MVPLGVWTDILELLYWVLTGKECFVSQDMSTLLAGSFELGDFENDAALSPGSTSGRGRLLHASIKDAIAIPHLTLSFACYHRLHLRRALKIGCGMLVSVHGSQDITHCSRVRRPYQTCFDSCILLSRFIQGDSDQKHAVLRCNLQPRHEVAHNAEDHTRYCHDRLKDP